MASSACSRVIFSFTRRCKSEVARKICRRGAAAGFSASIAALTSSFLARASAAIGTVRTSCDTLLTASRSPRDAIGKPASITSTFKAASWRARRIFSSVFIEKPGDCSPSRSVVSKMRTTSIGPPMDVVRIFDTTLRDGEQSPGFSMNTEEKIRLARQLAALKVDVIEAGFPIASRGDLEAVKKVAQEVRTVPIAALARAKKEDVSTAIEALKPAAAPRLHIFLATSDLHLRVK